MSCNHLSGQICQILQESCFKLGKETECDSLNCYNLVKNRLQDKPLAQEIKDKLLDPLIQSWKSYAKSPAPGKKDMTGRPFEKAVRAMIKEQLTPLGVNVSSTGKKYSFWKDLNIIADCLATKGAHHDCIFSMKTWIGEEQLRETFAYAYFAKLYHGQKNIKIYMIAFHSIPPQLQGLMVLCKSYLDGVYSLCGEPYIDDLLEELRGVYAQNI